jgi:NTE family protein
VRLENDSHYADEVITGMLDIPLGQPLDTGEMERSMLRVYSEDTFASVNYQLVEEDGRTGVIVRAREKPQGPNYLQAGFRMETDFSGNYESSLQLALLRAPVTPYGAEARILLGLGSEPGLQGEYYHPFDPAWRWYFYGRAGVQGSDMPLFNPAGDPIATYEGRVAGMALSLGRTFGRYGAAEIGLERTGGEAEVSVGDPDLPDLDLGAGTWFAWTQVDQLDSLYFPREGYSARLMYRATTGWLGGHADFEEVGLDLLGALPFGRHAVQGALAYHSTIDGVLPLSERHRMGGRGRLVGYHYNELTGQNYALVMLGYSYQLASVFRRSAVVGTTFEYGNAWELRRNMSWSDGVFNGSVYVGFDSWIGPMQFGYGLREGGDGVLFLEIGRPF